MVDSRILQALEHTNPAIRKKAIIALGKSHDQGALPILAKVYRNDPDPEVRDYAHKAGRYIYSLRQAPPVPVAPAPKTIPPLKKAPPPAQKPVESAIKSPQATIAPPKNQSPPKPPPVKKSVPVYVSQDEIEKAEQYVNLGFQAIHINELIAAEKIFRRAFDLNPSLIHDSYVVDAVHQLLKKSTPEESVTVLLKINYSAHIVLSNHALERMALRSISEEEITFAVEESDDHIFEDDGDVRFIKSIRRFDGQMRPLNVVAMPLETKSRVRDKWLIKTVYIRGEEDDGTIRSTVSYRNRNHRPSWNNNDSRDNRQSHNRNQYRNNSSRNNNYQKKYNKPRNYSKTQKASPSDVRLLNTITMVAVIIGLVFIAYIYIVSQS